VARIWSSENEYKKILKPKLAEAEAAISFLRAIGIHVPGKI
jgi:hypothetical protein